MSEEPARTMSPNDDFSNDEQHKQGTQSFQYYSRDQFVNQYDQQLSNSSGMVFHYSDRFPKMCMNMYFYEDIMKIAEKHIGNYRKYALTIYYNIIINITVFHWLLARNTNKCPYSVPRLRVFY